jgi:beta-xylosidase
MHARGFSVIRSADALEVAGGARRPQRPVVLRPALLLVPLLVCGACREDLRWDCPDQLQWDDDPLAGGLLSPLPIPAGTDGRTNADIADPHVIRADDGWVLYATSPGHDLRAWRSDDLCSWSEAQVVWEPGGWNERGMIWAPSVHPGDGGWYLYYTADLKVGVAWSLDPLGPFEDVLEGPLLDPGPGGVAIDPFLLEEDDGRLSLYSTWSPIEALSVTPLAGYAETAGDPIPLLRPGDAAWEGSIAEAPWVVRTEESFALMYSGNETWTDRYAVGVATSSDARGPFERVGDEPFLASDEQQGLYGPGHHSLVEAPDGSTLIFFHARQASGGGFDRRVFMGRLHLADDGTALLEPRP